MGSALDIDDDEISAARNAFEGRELAFSCRRGRIVDETRLNTGYLAENKVSASSNKERTAQQSAEVIYITQYLLLVNPLARPLSPAAAPPAQSD